MEAQATLVAIPAKVGGPPKGLAGAPSGSAGFQDERLSAVLEEDRKEEPSTMKRRKFVEH